MKKRTSIIVYPSVDNIRCRGVKGNLSRRLAVVAERYTNIIQSEYPDIFSEKEKKILINAIDINATFSTFQAENKTIILAVDKFLKKKKVKKTNKNELFEKISKLTYVQTIALIESIAEYWDIKLNE